MNGPLGSDSLAESIPNAPEFICPSPNVLDFNEKKDFIGRPKFVLLAMWIVSKVIMILGFSEFHQRPRRGTALSKESNRVSSGKKMKKKTYTCNSLP